MYRSLIGLAVAALLAPIVLAQAPQGRTFDAADVHPRARGSNPNPQWSGAVLRGGRYDVRNATMVDLISIAYGVDNARVLGGPNWLESDRFDVVAKAPQATTPDDVKLMLQALLAERFKLAVHKDQKSQPGFALVQNGKHKMKETKDPSAPGFCQPVPPPPPQPGVTPLNYASCTNITMESFVQQMRGMAAAYFSGPVIDATGLAGHWDFDLKWTQRAILAQAGADGISMFDAVEKQVGLKLEPRAVTVPVLIVDAVNEKPTENAADITKILPPAPPAEFEVATVKLSAPDQTQPMGRFQPGGRVDLQGFTLKMLMTLSWDINDDELIAGLPKWADDTRYSITARVSTAALGSQGTNGPPLDIDDMRLMMQALIVEKLKLKTHMEERPVTAYALLSTGAPKLAKADPANRTTWKNGVPAAGARDPRDSNPIISRLVTCQNMSMAQLADALPRMAPGYIRTPVVDATGIQGNFDFSFFFTPNGVGGIGGGNAGGTGAAPAPSSAADPSGAVSLYDAFTRQLGLKLEAQKRPLPVLVVDSVEQKPIDD